MVITLQSFFQPGVSSSGGGAAVLPLMIFMLISKSQDMIFLVLRSGECSLQQ